MSYNEEHIDRFLNGLNKAPENVNINKVHQMLNDPSVPARLTDTKSFKPLKLFTMTSIIVAGIVAWLAWPTSENQNAQHERDLEAPTEPKSTITIAEPEVATSSDEEKQIALIPQKTEAEEMPTRKPEASMKTKPSNGSNESTDQEPTFSKVDEKIVDSGITDPSENLEPCSWPEDTVIDGSKLIIDLKLEELTALGFEYKISEGKEYGLYYNNKHQGRNISLHKRFWFEENESSSYGESSGPGVGKHKRNTKIPTEYNFYPLYWTDFMGDVGPSVLTVSSEKYESINDTLVGIRIIGNYHLGSGESVLWFKTSNSFFKALPERYDFLGETMSCVKATKLKFNRDNLIHHKKIQIMDKVKPLTLSTETLKLIGLNFDNQEIQHYQVENENCPVHLFWGANREGVAFDLDSSKLSPHKVVFASDDKGKQIMRWNCGDGEKMSNEFFLNKYETLLPVILSSEKYTYLSSDRILWFESTPELLALIPGAIGEQIRQEYQYLISEDKTGLESSCTFFEACRSTLHLHDLKVFPNPSSGKLSLAFTQGAEEPMSISIADMNGRELLVLREETLLQHGAQNLEFDISSLPAGMYLMVMRTKDGYLSKRIIRQ